MRGAAATVAALVAVVALIAGGICALGWFTGLTKADGGHVIVVRNGGLFDDNSVRQVIQPNSGLTTTGLWSTGHEYPSTQRYFKVSGSKNADSNEIINVPTKDGVSVGVEGTFYFDMNLDPRTLESFDNKYGTRTYPTADGAKNAWDGDQGWNAFLSSTLGNLVQNVMRQEVGNVECSDLVASCSLAQNASATAAAAAGNHANGNQTIAQVQQAINDGFAKDVDSVLGVPIFAHPRFVLSKVDLPNNVQDAINTAQAAFAGVTKAQAGLAQADIDAQANAKRQQGYNSCATCAQIDVLKALPPGLTTYAPGSGFAVTGAGK